MILSPHITKVVLPRLPSWHARLADYLAAVQRLPYAVGIHDCALFAAGAVRAQTGRDLAADWRGYTTLEGGAKRLLKAGFPDTAALCAHHLAEGHLSEAAAGDIALVDDGASPHSPGALGVVQGEQVYVLRPEGLAHVGRCTMRRVFLVGRLARVRGVEWP